MLLSCIHAVHCSLEKAFLYISHGTFSAKASKVYQLHSMNEELKLSDLLKAHNEGRPRTRIGFRTLSGAVLRRCGRPVRGRAPKMLRGGACSALRREQHCLEIESSGLVDLK